jgi:hypothetical protein
MAFKLNYKNKFELETSGIVDPALITTEAPGTWATLAAGIQTATPAPGDTTDNTAYYNGGGFASTDVTGKNYSIAFAGHRVEGDAAQDFLVDKEFATGDDVKTLLRWTNPQGRVALVLVTWSAILSQGGDANAKQTFSTTANFNGAPTVTPDAG